MADILDFRPTGQRSVRQHRGGTAEIVIFPGVRYERWEATPASPKDKPKAKGRRKRDTLDLES